MAGKVTFGRAMSVVEHLHVAGPCTRFAIADAIQVGYGSQSLTQAIKEARLLVYGTGKTIERRMIDVNEPHLYELIGDGEMPTWSESDRWVSPNSWERIRILVLDRDGHQCCACGAEEQLHVDHRIPKSRGGTDDTANLWTLCAPCNFGKGTMTVNEWIGSGLPKSYSGLSEWFWKTAQ